MVIEGRDITFDERKFVSDGSRTDLEETDSVGESSKNENES